MTRSALAKDRVLVDFGSPEDAKRVEETVKTGYAETTVENIIHWIAAENDLRETYARLAEGSKDQRMSDVYGKLRDESATNIVELGELLKSLEAMDRSRVARIERLQGLLS